MANSDWLSFFPRASIQHLTSSRSDHKALLLPPYLDGQVTRTPIFRYEIMWEREEELGTIIESAWKKRNPGSDLGALAAAL